MITKKLLQFVVVALGLFVCTVSSFGQGQPSQMIVNIDNPNFRRLVIATPKFFATGGASESYAKWGEDGAEELARLLTFSGLFSVLSPSAYTEMADNLGKDLRSNQVSKNAANKALGKVVDSINISPWKAIGAEALTVGQIEVAGGEVSLTLRTIDINKAEMILGKKYSKVKREDLNSIMQRYADLLLEAYTGKPGIFSSKIAFVGRETRNSAKQIYICDVDGRNVRRLTKGNYPHLAPVWSRDGRYLVYTSFSRKKAEVFLLDLSTGRSKRLAGDRNMNSGGSWSHNDKYIVYQASRDGDTDLYVITPNGDKASLFVKGTGVDVESAFSPDGKWIAYVSGRFGNPHIFRGSLDWSAKAGVGVSEDKRLTFAGWYNANPAWSPDSERIAFAGYDKDIDRFDLFVMDHDGKNLQRLTLRAGDNEHPSYAPNGQLIVFHSNRDGERDKKKLNQLWMMHRDGSQQKLINTGMYEAQSPSWSAPLAPDVKIKSE